MQQRAFGRLTMTAARSRPWRAMRRAFDRMVEFWRRQSLDHFWPPHP
ncbi:MAG: hypothetical protein HY060_26745 [Proteobacteria bacterium]|nr:hypothetical protein [Pseudomonadota bacterium]